MKIPFYFFTCIFLKEDVVVKTKKMSTNSVSKCLTPRLLRHLSRRGGYNNKLSPETRETARAAFHSYMDGVIHDAVLYAQATPHAKSLKLSHVLLALQRRGVILCGVEGKRKKPAAATPVKTTISK